MTDSAKSLLGELDALLGRGRRLVRRQLAARLRRFADRIDSPEATPPAQTKLITRAELREIQAKGLQMVADFHYVGRGARHGLLWFPRGVLESIDWLVTTELETRDRDFATIEKNPQTVWQ